MAAHAQAMFLDGIILMNIIVALISIIAVRVHGSHLLTQYSIALSALIAQNAIDANSDVI